MTDDSFLKWSMSERSRRLKRWAHFVRCEIPLHKDEQEFLGDGTDLASELEEAAEALTKLKADKDELEKQRLDLIEGAMENARKIDALTAQVKRYREALVPFAEEAKEYCCDDRPHDDVVRPCIRAGHLQKAHAYLGALQDRLVPTSGHAIPGRSRRMGTLKQERVLASCLSGKAYADEPSPSDSVEGLAERLRVRAEVCQRDIHGAFDLEAEVMIEAAKALKRLEQERDENWQRYVDADAALLDAQDEIATLKEDVEAMRGVLTLKGGE